MPLFKRGSLTWVDVASRRAKGGGTLTLVCALGALCLAAAPKRPGIYVEVSDLRNAEGHVRCGLFSDADNWLSDSPTQGDKVDIRKGKATCIFRDVKPGVYGVTVLHDEDDSGDMTKSALGLPEEGYAASRDAVRESVARPNWKDARFRYEGGVKKLNTRIHYP